MTFTNKKSLIALLLTFVLVFSLFAVSALADDTTVADENESVVEVVTGEDVTVGSTGTQEGTEEEKGSEAVSTESSSEKTSEEASTEEHDHEEETETAISSDVVNQNYASAKKNLIINGIIIAAIIVILVVVAIKFREKLASFFRSVKSERKKIVWSSKENTLKGFLVVIVVVAAIALMIGLIDFAFETGIDSLNSLFNK